MRDGVRNVSRCFPHHGPYSEPFSKAVGLCPNHDVAGRRHILTLIRTSSKRLSQPIFDPLDNP